MNNDTIMFLLDCIMVALGFYVLTITLAMRKSGVVPLAFVAPEEMKKCRDETGFIGYLFPRAMIFAIICLLCGILTILNDTGFLPSFLPKGGMLGTGLLLLFLLGWLFLSFSIRKGKQTYFR